MRIVKINFAAASQWPRVLIELIVCGYHTKRTVLMHTTVMVPIL